MKTLKEHLKKEEINTLAVLKEMWEDIKSSLPLSIGMKIVLEEEMQSLWKELCTYKKWFYYEKRDWLI